MSPSTAEAELVAADVGLRLEALPAQTQTRTPTQNCKVPTQLVQGCARPHGALKRRVESVDSWVVESDVVQLACEGAFAAWPTQDDLRQRPIIMIALVTL